MGQHKLNKNKPHDPRTEQWNLNGYCEICRRAKFCGKPCKANERRTRQELTAMAMRAMMRVATRHEDPVTAALNTIEEAQNDD